jgi:hypothetical protein
VSGERPPASKETLEPLVRPSACLFASVVAFLVFCTALAACSEGATGPSRDGSAQAVESSFSLGQAKAFADFSLYAPGDSFEDLPLTAVLRRFDSAAQSAPVRANFVGFLYGSCQPGPDSGCMVPLDVQVWAACERNPGVYSPELAREEPVTVRGVPAYFYEGGRRLELATGTSTVVLFAQDREHALRAAAALEGINNPITADEDLPAPAYTREPQPGVIEVLPCPYDQPPRDEAKAARIEQEMSESLTPAAEAGHNQRPRSVECTRSDAFTQVGELDDFHNCEIVWADGTTDAWCVLSNGERAFHGTLPDDCETAAAGGWGSSVEEHPPPPELDERTLAWGRHANAACGKWSERRINVIANLDQELVSTDLSYVWWVARPYEAGIVGDLRAIPRRTPRAQKALALYERRLALLDRALEDWRQDRRRRALAAFDRLEDDKLRLNEHFAGIGAEACSPP